MTMNAPDSPRPQPVKLPDELWFDVLRANRCDHAGGFIGAIRLFDGSVLPEMIVDDLGFIRGRPASGFPVAHGTIDDGVLTFRTRDVEAVQLPSNHLWQQAKWVALDANHPLRKAWEERSAGAAGEPGAAP